MCFKKSENGNNQFFIPKKHSISSTKKYLLSLFCMKLVKDKTFISCMHLSHNVKFTYI